jgi:3',5'-cyclic AMP phosphodiesterase CpdA
MRRMIAALAWLVAGGWLLAEPLTLPHSADSLKFAVIGDNGTGDRLQFEVAERMAARQEQFPFDLVLMVGDNFYGSQTPADLVNKFERPYKRLLDAGVTFRAALGNHDEVATIGYLPLNMQGQRYYTFTRQNVRFVVLDTNVLDRPQLRWAETALRESREAWRIVYFHHPIYGNAGRHGANVDIRVLLEPLLVKHDVHVVFSGHDHVYERLKPQRGIHYFVTGSSGKLRQGDLRPADTTAAGFDQDCTFMLVEVEGDDLFFETVSRAGATVDSGHIRRARRTGT